MSFTKKIAIIPGKFQILTNGHIKLFNEALENNDFLYILVCGKEVEPSEKNPISLNFRVSILKTLESGKTKIVKADSIIPGGVANLDLLGDYIAKDLDLSPSKGKALVTIYCGSDRTAYESQLKYFNGFDKDGIDKTKGKKNIFDAQLKSISRNETSFDASNDETYKSSVAKSLMFKYFTSKEEKEKRETLESLRKMLPTIVFQKLDEYWSKYLSKVYTIQDSVLKRMYKELV